MLTVPLPSTSPVDVVGPDEDSAVNVADLTAPQLTTLALQATKRKRAVVIPLGTGMVKSSMWVLTPGVVGVTVTESTGLPSTSSIAKVRAVRVKSNSLLAIFLVNQVTVLEMLSMP